VTLAGGGYPPAAGGGVVHEKVGHRARMAVRPDADQCHLAILNDVGVALAGKLRPCPGQNPGLDDEDAARVEMSGHGAGGRAQSLDAGGVADRAE
jgi:hypothetical protein